MLPRSGPRLLRCCLLKALCFFTGIIAQETAPPRDLDSLTLQQCFTLAGQRNAALQRAIAHLEQTRGEEIVVRSRLLPHIGLDYRGAFKIALDSADAEGKRLRSEDQALDVRLQQRIVEFGKTDESEFERLRRRRRALYSYENEAAGVFAAVRRAFYELLITQRQLQAHDSLLAIYTKKLAVANDRLANGVALKTTVLTARLNRLEERERILRLKTKRHQLEARLKELLGLRILPDGISGAPISRGISFNEDSCVAIALQRSTKIADADAEVRLMKKKLVQWGWEFAPDIALSAGVARGTHKGELRLSGNAPDSRRRWALDAVGTETLIEPSGALANERLGGAALFGERDTTLRFTAAVQMEFPVLKGLRRKGTRIEAGALYARARAELVSATREIETKARSAYYEYAMSLENLAIVQERVAIDRERYELAEVQYEMGKMGEDGLDSFRERLFKSQDAYFGQQFTVREKQEALRAIIRYFEEME